jgi:beta-lactamase regulating signal transducer with metallopeptidase domain
MLGSSDLIHIDQGLVALLIIATLKATIMLAGARVAGLMLKRNSATVRHLVWCVALLSSLVFLVGANKLERWELPVLPKPLSADGAFARQVSPNNESPNETQPAVASVQGETKPGSARAPSVDKPLRMSWQSLVLLVWAVGMLLVLLRLIVGTIRVRRIVRNATPLTDSSWSGLIDELSRELRFARPVKVLRSNQSVMPITCGVLSPVVLLPNGADEWSVDRRRVVLLHELIHVKRRDLLTQTLAQLVCALYWFNPLVWFAVAQLRKEQEWACDERVVAAGIKASDYAGHLLELGRKFSARDWTAVTTTAIVRRSQLEQRLRAILQPAFQQSRSKLMKAASISVLSVVFVLLAGTQLVGTERVTVNPLPLIVSPQSNQEKPSAPAKQSPPGNQSPRQTPSPTPTTEPASNETGDDEMAAAEQAFNSFSAQERNNLMNNGIGPAYIQEMAGVGYRKLTAAQLIALFSNSVRANYVTSLDSVGYRNLPLPILLSLKTNGITADVIKSFQAVKYADFEALNFPAFTTNGVPPSYLKSMKALGYDKMTPKQIVDMWVAGVTPDFVRDASKRSQTNLSPEELIELKKREKP